MRMRLGTASFREVLGPVSGTEWGCHHGWVRTVLVLIVVLPELTAPLPPTGSLRKEP